MNTVYLYDHSAKLPTWEIIAELPDLPDKIIFGAAIIQKVPSRTFISEEYG